MQNQRTGISRRALLLGGVQVAATLPILGRIGLANAARPDRILVVLQLTGGNDGLNTVIPTEQDTYYRSRPVLSQVTRGAHRVTDDFAFHPSLPRLAGRARAGTVGVVHSVGIRPPDRSHFHSMGCWHAGRLAAELETTRDTSGWLGRAARALEERGESSGLALHVGDSRTPESLAWPGRAPVRLAHPDEWKLAPRDPLAERLAKAQRADASGDTDLAYLARTASEATRLQERLERASRTDSAVSWPGFPLARHLRLVARLIDGGLGASIYSAELGGFDTHLDQPGTHERLLDHLDRALDAFLRDLESKDLSDRVAVLVFSEFGRRVAENKSAGTDHGAAGPCLVAGGALRGGHHGAVPDLTDLLDGDVPPRADFRAVQQACTAGWLGLPSEPAPEPLELFDV